MRISTFKVGQNPFILKNQKLKAKSTTQGIPRRSPKVNNTNDNTSQVNTKW